MPLGPIAALLVREGVVNGFRVAAGAAAGVATVDLGYCAGAAIAGAAQSQAIDNHRALVLVVSGIVVVAIGAQQAWMALRVGCQEVEVAAHPTARPSALRRYAQFVGLTVINPMTLVYFMALAGAMAVLGGTWAQPALFVGAVGVASLSWQLLLAAVGAVLGGVVTPQVSRVVGIVASLVVVTLGVGVVARGVALVA